MESQQSQTWFDIAKKVNALLGLPGARERFRDCVKEATAEWQRRSDTKQKRKEARTEAVKTTGIPLPTSEESSRLPPNPMDGSFSWSAFIPDRSAPDQRSPWIAWLPAELSPDLDPDDSPPLPVPEDREVSLAERYAVLAAVWDARWMGDEKIDPWRRWRQSRPGVMGEEKYKEYKREGMPGIAYALLVSLVGLTTGDAPTGRLSEKDAVIVQTWLADVDADLARQGEVESANDRAPFGFPTPPQQPKSQPRER
jgi:hypothetical protein